MPEKDWESLGELSEGVKVGAVAASPEGFGLLGATWEPSGGSLLERMRARRAHLYRAAGGGVTKTWEGAGWVQALDCHGAVCAAIHATLKHAGSGSDYHLLVSTDGGREWHPRGAVPAPSLGQVLAVSAQELWVLGAWYLGRTTDGGTTWTELELEGERNPHTERLRRGQGGVALTGQGFYFTDEGGASWAHHPLGGARILDVDGTHVAAVVGGQARVGEYQAPDVRWLAPLPEGREPVRLVSAQGVLRLLTRNADPSRGSDMALHTSEDGGQTWTHHALPLGPQVDVAGREWGVGADVSRRVFGRVA